MSVSASDWMKMRTNLWDDPRVGAMADEVGTGEAAIIGALYWLWATADEHSTDGLLAGMTLRQIDRKTGVSGFAAALVRVGWVIESEDGAQIVRFTEHNGKSAKRRAAESVRKTSARDADKFRNKSGHDAHLEEEVEEEIEEPTEPIGSVVPGEPGTEGEQVERDKPKAPPCPHAEIIALYHETLPSLARVREWTEARQAFLRKRWTENAERQSLDWWRGFFEYVGESSWLTGRKPGRDGDAFECDLEWLVRPRNFVKVIEGKYHRGAAA